MLPKRGLKPLILLSSTETMAGNRQAKHPRGCQNPSGPCATAHSPSTKEFLPGLVQPEPEGASTTWKLCWNFGLRRFEARAKGSRLSRSTSRVPEWRVLYSSEVQLSKPGFRRPKAKSKHASVNRNTEKMMTGVVVAAGAVVVARLVLLLIISNITGRHPKSIVPPKLCC